MKFPPRWIALALSCCLFPLSWSFGSAYNAHPKLLVIVIIDQFRGDYLERYHDQFGEGGFRLLLDHGANFTDCNYDYANTRTAPGHATLLTGAYSNGHGIVANKWWDPQKKRSVTSVEDDNTRLIGIPGNAAGASPHNLLADTLGDELKLATQGKSRIFGIALKDRASILSTGFATDAAYWTDHQTGLWITSTYYHSELPRWTQDFNNGKHAEKYLNKEWTDSQGNAWNTSPVAGASGKETSFYELVGPTPLANDYELEFARALVTNERLGSGPATDLLVIGLSANDILGHHVGPDSPRMGALALTMDHQLAEFFSFLGQQIGMANVWIALSADHGIAPLPSVASSLHIPATNLSIEKMRSQMNQWLTSKLSPGRPAEYVKEFDYPLAWLDADAFAAIKMTEEDAERAVGDALKEAGLRNYYTRSQLAEGRVPNTDIGLKYQHSYSPLGGWYVMGVPVPYAVGGTGTDHASPYTYDTHVPLVFYGIPFQPGTYRTHAEPVDLAVTLASLLGINAPTHAVGRVLTEALITSHRAESSPHPESERPRSGMPSEQIEPVALVARGHTQ